MANSAIAIRLDTSQFKDELKNLENRFSATMAELVSWQEKSNVLTQKTIDLEKKLAAARSNLATKKRGTDDYKKASLEVKRLSAEVRQAKAEQRAAANISRELSRQMREQASSANKLRGSIKNLSATEKKADAIRDSSVNTIVRKIRQYETMIVMFYTLKKGYDATIGASLEYNAMIERETIGLKMLINQTTEYINAQGEVLKGFEAMAAAGVDAQEAIKIVKDINIETPHTLLQTLSIFKLLVPQVKQFGGSLEDVGEITKGVSVLAANMGVEFQEILKVADSLMSGQMHESGLKRAMAVVGITNQEIRKIKKEGGDLVAFFEDRLKVVSKYGEEVKGSFYGVTTQFKTLIDTIRGETFKDIFVGIKVELAKVNEYLKENNEEITKGLKETITLVRNLARPVAELGILFMAIKSIGSLKKLILGTGAALLPPQLKAIAIALGGIYAALKLGGAQIKANRESLEEYYKKQRELAEKSYFLPLENKEKDNELIEKQKALGKELSEAYKKGDAERAKNIAAQLKEIAIARQQLRVDFNKLMDEGKGDGITSRQKPIIDFTTTEEFKKQLDEAIKYAELKSELLTGQISEGWYKAKVAIEKYNDAEKKLKELKEKTTLPGVDKEDLKKEIIEAEVELRERENELIKIGNELNEKGLSLISKKNEENKRAIKELEDLKRKYIDDYAENEERRNDYLKLTELYNAGIISSQEEYNKLLDEMIKKWGESQKPTKALKTELEEIKDLIGGKLENAMTQTFRSWMDGAMKFGDLMSGIIKDIATEFIRISVIKPFIDTIIPSANGNVISGGAVQPFASGGIVTSPVLFPMANGAGLMGEAGPEAIMPLTRINGDLGVKAMPSNVIINVSNETGLPVDMEQIGQYTDDNGDHIISVVMKHAQTNPDFRAVMGIK